VGKEAENLKDDWYETGRCLWHQLATTKVGSLKNCIGPKAI
jgi:hypothetical protein